MTTSQSTSFGVNATKTPEQLFEENYKLAYSVLWRKYPTYANDEDIQQEALIGLWKACTTYDNKKTQFSTYAYSCIVNQVKLYFRDHADKVDVLSMEMFIEDKELSLEELIADPMATISDSYLDLKMFLNNLPLRERRLLRYKIEGVPQEQIAKILGITPAWCSALLTKIRVSYYKWRDGDD